MSIFSDFDSSYGEYYSGIPAADGTIDVVNGGTVVDNIDPQVSGMIDGNMIMQANNVEGGQDTLVNGSQEIHTQPNVYGGEDIYENGNITHTSIPNEHGGFDIYDEDMHREGTTFSNIHGSEDYLSATGNTEEILSNDDPLRYSQNLRFDPFDVH